MVAGHGEATAQAWARAVAVVWLLDANLRVGSIASEAVRDVSAALEDVAGSEFHSLLSQ